MIYWHDRQNVSKGGAEQVDGVWGLGSGVWGRRGGAATAHVVKMERAFWPILAAYLQEVIMKDAL